MQFLKSKYTSVIFVILLSNIFSIFLVVFRFIYTKEWRFFFMIWNLILAWVPFITAIVIYKYFTSIPKRNWVKRVAAILLFVIWFLFLPNAFYIFTDLIHLRSTFEIGLWFDLILISSFVWNGFLLGFISLALIQKSVKRKYNNLVSWVIVIITIILSSFGIYLGRFLRWNSWDILTNPGDLVSDVANRIVDPFSHLTTWGVTIILSAFLAVIYLTILVLYKAAKHHQDKDSLN